MDMITRENLAGLFQAVAEIMAENSELMCEMDAKMGDGDLGLTMKKGFAAAYAAITELPEPDMGKLIMKSGMKMSSAVPSTMGTLMASGMMQGGKAIAGKEQLGPGELAAFLEGYAAGIQNRGKCARGERTVLDAVGAAADGAKDALAQNESATLADVAAAALKGAEEGLEATRSMAPKYGKAAVHAAKAAGEIDQGAFAGCCLIRGIANYICG